MGNKILPKEFPELSESIYAGFTLRTKALLTDFIIFLPIAILNFILTKVDKNYLIYSSILTYTFFIFYYIFLVYKYEGTPGKRLCKIKVRKKNGKRIGLKEAILRESVGLFLAGFLRYSYVLTALKLSNGDFSYQDFESLRPNWYPFLDWIYDIWLWSEIIIILLNKRKRALHDFIAGTVVIKDKYQKLAEQ